MSVILGIIIVICALVILAESIWGRAKERRKYWQYGYKDGYTEGAKDQAQQVPFAGRTDLAPLEYKESDLTAEEIEYRVELRKRAEAHHDL